ncbi:hypothetical protein BC938DRAFT_478633 [Jimgerdemannia flammicorona]|uniref:Arrestin-like N-terminal domain-containing protein n=1 Tax=Jimgerdemannia flammicorona TaxID=994334 RepID=A0A433QMK0_9FUNG|nr:hypothetical protein BC938DRAFT_478633 [Jimgerdemannia flammicorona]
MTSTHLGQYLVQDPDYLERHTYRFCVIGWCSRSLPRFEYSIIYTPGSLSNRLFIHTTSMKKIIAVDVIPDSGIIEFCGPTTTTTPYILRGKVRLVLSAPLKIKRLMLAFEGMNRLHAVRIGACYQIEERLSGPTVEAPIRPGRTIVQSAATLPAGVTDLPFEMTLEGDIPPSYELGQLASVEYALTAIVVPTALLSKSAIFRKGVIVERHLVPGIASASFNGVRRQMNGMREGVIEYHVDVPKIISADQGITTIFLKLNVLSIHGRPENVTVVLEQLIQGRMKSKDRFRPVTINAGNLEGTFTKPIASFFRDLSRTSWPIGGPTDLTIPLSLTGRIQADIDSPLADLTHRLCVSITFASRDERDMNLIFSIIVTSVPPALVGAEDHFVAEFDVDVLPMYQTVLQDPVMAYSYPSLSAA